jgi:hypothetical protein
VGGKRMLTVNESKKYDVIKDVVEDKRSKVNAQAKLCLSTKQINRLIKKYKEKGKQGFVHGNVGNKILIR